MQGDPSFVRAQPEPQGRRPAEDHQEHPHDIGRNDARNGHEGPRDPGELHLHPLVEPLELGDDLDEHHGQEATHHAEEQRRIDGGRDGLLPQGLGQAQVLGHPAQHPVEVAAPFPRDQAGGKDRRIELALGLEGLGQRHAGFDAIPDREQGPSERGVLLPLQHHVQGLEEGQACLQEGGQLLSEEEQRVGGDPRTRNPRSLRPIPRRTPKR